MRHLLLILGIICFAIKPLHAQSFGIAYYNVDNLYDTIPSPFYDDRAHTANGRLAWNTERYKKKIANITSVIDSMAMPLVAIYGVENEQVVKDIVCTSNNDYAYIHHNADSYNGLDFALLYFGDIFFPTQTTPWQGALCVEGELHDKPLTIIISHSCKSLGVLLNRKTNDQNSKIIVLGDIGKLNFNKLNLCNTLSEAEKQGRGNCISQNEWKMRDKIITNICNYSTSDAYAQSWILDSAGRPLSTYKGGKYIGGYSSWLPIYIYFKK